MRPNTPIQYTVRGVPPEVDQALRKKARERRVSLNRLLVEELSSLSGAEGGRQYRSLKELTSRWKEDPEFDRVIEEQRRIDWKLWK